MPNLCPATKRIQATNLPPFPQNHPENQSFSGDLQGNKNQSTSPASSSNQSKIWQELPPPPPPPTFPPLTHNCYRKFSWFQNNTIRLKHLTVQKQRCKSQLTHLLNKFLGFTTTDHKIIFSIIDLFPLFPFRTPKKHQENYGSLMFSGCAKPGKLENDRPTYS